MSHNSTFNYNLTSEDGDIHASFLVSSWGTFVTLKSDITKANFDPKSEQDIEHWKSLLNEVSNRLKSTQLDTSAANLAPLSRQGVPSYVSSDVVSEKPIRSKKADSHADEMVTENDLDEFSSATYRISQEVYEQIHDKIGKHMPELGGMLGGSRKDRKVTHFHFDEGADATAGTYSPDTYTLNKVLKSWNEQGIDLVGMIHSHAKNFTRPSHGDEVYAKEFLKVCKDMKEFFMPIVQSERHGRFDIKAYVVSRHSSGKPRLAPVDYRLI